MAPCEMARQRSPFDDGCPARGGLRAPWCLSDERFSEGRAGRGGRLCTRPFVSRVSDQSALGAQRVSLAALAIPLHVVASSQSTHAERVHAVWSCFAAGEPRRS